MMVNQRGEPIVEESISFAFLTLQERVEVTDLLLAHLKLQIVRTNATKDGRFELQLWPVGDGS